MPEIKKKHTHREPRHKFFLNHFEDNAFTNCPKCEEKTKIRKHCLTIHIEPKYLLSLKKSCRYCPSCDLIIVKKAEFESLLVAICERYVPEIIGNRYDVIGTMDRKDWKDAKTGEISEDEGIKRTYPFKNVYDFKLVHEGERLFWE